MKLGIIIYSTDSEVVFNAFRLANFSLEKEDEVSVFLMAKGVEFVIFMDNQNHKNIRISKNLEVFRRKLNHKIVNKQLHY